MIQVKLTALTLGVGRDFSQAHFFNEKRGQCDKYEKLASIRIWNFLHEFKQNLPFRYKCTHDSYCNNSVKLQ